MFYAFMFLVLPVLIPWPVLIDGGLVFNFKGKEYISYESSLDDDVQDVRMPSLKNRYNIRFKTIHPSGILLFAEGRQEDYISIVLLHCKLRVVICRLKQKDFPPDELRVVMGNNLCDGKWHFVDITRIRKRVSIKLDHIKQHHTIPGQFTTLDLNLHTFVAGVDKTTIKPSNKYHNITQVPNYRGCLRGIILNQTNLLEAAKKKNKHFKIHGSLTEGCHDEGTKGLVGFHADSFLKLLAPAKKTLLLSFVFRTYHDKGLLFYSQSSLFVKLSLVSGGLELQPYMKRKGFKNLRFRLGRNLADGNWHAVKVYVNNNGFTLFLDKEKIHWSKPKQLKGVNLFSYKTVVFGAGMGLKSFIGCLNQLKINRVFINAININQHSEHSGLQISSCPIKNACFPNPCRNGGKCSNEGQYSICNCRSVYYTGSLCTNPLYRSSCQEYTNELGLSRDSECSIVPDQNNTSTPIKVLCRMSGSSISATEIAHEKKGWWKVDRDVSYFYRSYLITKFDYSVKIPYMKAVISRSRRCHQYMAINESLSLLNSSETTKPHAYWVSFNKERDPIPFNTNGYVRDKSLLPVIAVMFKSAAIGSYYHIGPLKCYGTKKPSQKLPPSVIPWLLKSLCKPLVEPRANHHPEDNITEVITLETKSQSLMSQTSGRLKMDEKPSMSNIATMAVTRVARKTPLSTEEPDKNMLKMKKFKKLKHKAITMSWEFLVIVVAISAIVFLVVCHLCFVLLVKKKVFKRNTCDEAMSLKRDIGSIDMICRDSISDETTELQPETDMWMKLNAGGYNVKTGKITYGYDIY